MRWGWAPLALLGLASCTDLGDPTALSIGDRTLTLKDLRRAYARLPAAGRPLLGTKESRREFVDLVVERRLLAEHGAALTGPEAAANEEAIERYRFDLVNRRFRTLLGGEQEVTEEEVRAAYERLAIRHGIRRLSFLTREGAEAALPALRAGGTFEEIAAGSKATLLRGSTWIVWTAFPEVLGDAVAELEIGGTSDPIRVGSRYVLAQVIERAPVEEVPPFDEVRNRLVRGLRIRKQNAEIEDFVLNLQSRKKLEFFDEGIELLTRRGREAILGGDYTEHDTEWAIPRLTAGEGEQLVARWAGGGRWTANDYREAVSRLIPVRRPHRGRLESEVRHLCESEVAKELLFEEALRQGVDKDWWVQQSMEAFRTDRYVQLAVEQIGKGAEVSQAAVDSIAMILETNRPQVFRRGEMARLVRYDFESRDAAVEEVARIREAGGSMKRLAEILEGDSRFEGDYHLSDLSREGVVNPEMERVLFSSPSGELFGPYESQGKWSLVEGLAVEAPVVLTPEEIWQSIQSQLRRGESRRYVSDWVASRRQTLGVAIDEAVLDLLAPGA